MKVFKLQIDDFDEVSFDLIAIHSSLEDYRLAFFLNQKLPVLLEKSKKPIEVMTKNGEVCFTKFTYFDINQDLGWNLFQNKNEIEIIETINNQNLFMNTEMAIATPVFMLPEFKKVDFFLKIENQNSNYNIVEIVSKIKKIKSISTVYHIDNQSIKSKNNLIFQ